MSQQVVGGSVSGDSSTEYTKGGLEAHTREAAESALSMGICAYMHCKCTTKNISITILYDNAALGLSDKDRESDNSEEDKDSEKLDALDDDDLPGEDDWSKIPQQSGSNLSCRVDHSGHLLNDWYKQDEVDLEIQYSGEEIEEEDIGGVDSDDKGNWGSDCNA
ncbi:hypothetical protein BT96DRAFT_950591 [Gymnopus androsaceus JB14]|uniref:Uncharacterized protein n=1 Tax=Gymnopus androsaceus JB14 TaxID=1447944 RepID=A0A6A4GG08_9AGAR|nr:hypothetical protein BT96DRAFT_950591 [Gymnopus androsaceus JB14]